MSKNDKLVEKVLSNSCDITFSEIIKFLKIFGYSLSNKGKTSGSRVVFTDDNGSKIYFHRPHPGNIVKKAYIREMIFLLAKEGKIWLVIYIIRIM